MPDIGTTAGLGQMIAMGVAFLAIIALRCRRYGTDLFKSFIWIWSAACVGLGIAAVVELHLPPLDAAVRSAAVYLPVAAAAWFGGKALARRST